VTALVSTRGERIALAIDRWRTDADPLEHGLLTGLPDPVLDVGCGPGRIVAALAGAGRVALGVDPSPAAVLEAARRRAPALRRSVFDPLPGEGRWGTVLLLDGNVGIGGDPVALLRRAAELTRPAGVVVAEVDPPGWPTRALTVRVETAGRAGPWFPWARVGADAVDALAARAGLGSVGVCAAGGRWFARAVAR
jgi:SAM-dependent methyltransferase